MRRSVRLTMCCALLATLCARASAGVVVVEPDPGNGPLAAALALLEDGDKLVLKAGTYDERLTLVGLTKVKVIAKGEVIFDAVGPSASISITNCDRVSIRGVTVRDAPSQGVLVSGSTKVTLEKCTVENHLSQGIFVSDSPELRVLACTVVGGSNGISLTGATSAKVIGNSVSDTATQSIFVVDVSLPDTKIVKNVVSGSGNAAIELAGAGNRADRNTISDSLFGVVTPFTGGDMAGSTIRRNTITDTVVALRTYASGGLLLSGNRVEDASASALQIASLAVDVMVTKNRVDGANSGIDDEGTGSFVAKNKIAATNIYGIRARGTTGTFERNRVNDTPGDGFDVWTSGNTFERNKASGNAGLDLDSSGLAESENTYVKNSFGTVAFD